MACVLVLLLSQALIGALSLAALKQQSLENTAERVGLFVEQTAGQVRMGMSLGKPLAQYFGLSRLLAGLRDALPDLGGADVVLADGHRLAALGGAVEDTTVLQALRALDPLQPAPPGTVRLQASGAAWQAVGHRLTVAAPLRGSAGELLGAVRVWVPSQIPEQDALIRDNLQVLALSTLGAVLLLLWLLRPMVLRHDLAGIGRFRLLLPLFALLLAQGAYVAHTIHAFQGTWREVTRQNTQALGSRLQSDLDRVLAYGIAADRMQAVELPMARLAAAFPVIQEIRLVDAQGRWLNRADAHGALPVPPDAAATRTRRLGHLAEPDDSLLFPLHGRAQTPVAHIQILLDGARMTDGIRARILDAATVMVVALVATFELLLLLALLMDRVLLRHESHEPGVVTDDADPVRPGRIARPVMFGFLFAMAMPLSFLPLYARSLLPLVQQARGFEYLLGVPIAADMGCGLVAALLAGRLTDRRGWALPVLAGLLVGMAGNVASGLAPSWSTLVAARALAGFGYGLAWMGLQGFIVLHSPVAHRGRNMAILVAGLFAGYLSGAAAGAMLEQQLGAIAVFLLSAGLLALPFLGVFMLMGPGRQGVPLERSRPSRPGPGLSVAMSWRTLRALVFSRDYGLLLLACIVPFSVAQAGLLSYALPLYVEAAGGTTASVGRMIMLYGLCVIYLGPPMARITDGSAHRKAWIVAGGVFGSAGLLGLYWGDGLAMATGAVLCLAVASCLAGSAQLAYMLQLRNVRDYGAGRATSVMRAADKFGQMLGPLLVGALLAWVSLPVGLAGVGLIYLLATLAFWRFAPRRPKPEPVAERPAQ